MKGITNVINKKPSHVEKVNIELKTNQSDHTDLIGTTFNVSYGEYTNSYTWNGKTLTIAIPAYVEYTITYEGVDNYKTPESVTYVAQDGNARSVVATYLTESVTVVLTADNGGNVIGQQITINGVVHTYNGIAAIQKVPFDTSYEISVSNKDGYNTPTSQIYTAEISQRNVNLEYTEIQYGVRIVTTDGKYIKAEDWDNSKKANGISLITENVRLIVALTATTDETIKYGSPYEHLDKMVIIPTEVEAIIDYNGVENTEIGMNYCKWQTVFTICTSFIFPDGVTTGYLGAAGEWVEVANNITEINEALTACGGDVIELGNWEIDYGYATSSYAGENNINYDWWVMVPKTKTLNKIPSNHTYKCRIFGNI